MERIFLKRGTIEGARLQEIRQIPVNFRASSSHYTTRLNMSCTKLQIVVHTTQHSKNMNQNYS